MTGTWLSLRHFKTRPEDTHTGAGAGEPLAPVSILKPLKGSDLGLEENLETFFQIEYAPGFELIFSIADAADSAGPIVRKLMAEYPAVRARLNVGAVEVGPNPKVNNLVNAYREAQHDLVLISDSNVRVEPSYLTKLVSEMRPGVGIVSAAVSGTHPEGIGGILEALYLNTFYIRGNILAKTVGIPCVVGKCMLFRRSVAARFGGLEALGRYLAEDYMAGVAMRKLNLDVVISRRPVVQHVSFQTFKAHWDRHVRWGRIRKVQAPLAFIGEFFTSSLVSGLCGAWAMSSLFDFYPSGVLALHFAFWSACDFLVLMRIEPNFHPLTPIAWFAREILALPLWIHVASGNTVSWRGSKLKVLPGGTLEIREAKNHAAL